jgi:hypothetical protein
VQLLVYAILFIYGVVVVMNYTLPLLAIGLTRRKAIFPAVVLTGFSVAVSGAVIWFCDISRINTASGWLLWIVTAGLPAFLALIAAAFCISSFLPTKKGPTAPSEPPLLDRGRSPEAGKEPSRTRGVLTLD